MIDVLFDYLNAFEDVVWSYLCFPLIIVLGIYLTYASRGLQIRKFPSVMSHFFQYLTRGKTEECANVVGVHPLKASLACVAACVGIGNIVAVTTAIEIGGPGALFWVWMTAIIGSLVKYAEVCLGMRFRVVATGDEKGFRGGPMYYLKAAFSSTTSRILIQFFCVLMMLYGVEIFQFHVVAVSIADNFSLPRLPIALALVALVVFSEAGGSNRIGSICSAIIPPCIIAYVGMGLYVLIINIGVLPQVVLEVFRSAFTSTAAVGGFAGGSIMMAVSQGIRRGCYSSDIGVGYASILHSESSERNPAKQASLTIVEVFFDIFLMCTMSVALVLVTGVWCDETSSSVMLVQAALARYVPYMHFFMPFFIFLLGYTTIITYFSAGMKTAQFLFPKMGRFLYTLYSSIMFVYFTFQDLTRASCAMSLVLAALLILNVIAIWKLRKHVVYDFDSELSYVPSLAQSG